MNGFILTCFDPSKGNEFKRLFATDSNMSSLRGVIPDAPHRRPNCWGVILLNRDRAYYRYQRNKHIGRKIHILKGYGEWRMDGWMREQPGRLAKGKIHCSCPMCREKSYDDWSQSDKRSILSGKQQLEDLCEGDKE